MSFLRKKLGAVAVVSGLLLTCMLLSTCGSPLGFGKRVDWEPPVITLTGYSLDGWETWNPEVPSPLYVKNGVMLGGTAVDNEKVARVVLSDNVTGEELLTATLNGDQWRLVLEFDDSRNGEKIMAAISAYDTSGNCGADSIVFITLIIDTKPPRIENISIQRTNTRPGRLEGYSALKELETSDPNGEKKENLYRYQNGWFYIKGILNDAETKIESVSLKIYDVTEIDTVLKEYEKIDTSTNYFPTWLIKEEDLIDAGVVKWGSSYRSNYYDNKERYYYRVAIEAVDKSKNLAEIVIEEEGYMCMWVDSDLPRGVLSPDIRRMAAYDRESSAEEKTTIARGTPLPVDFFDDDSLLWGYAALFTEEQWAGNRDVYTGSVKIQGATDQAKVYWLKQRFTGTDENNLNITNVEPAVFNWDYDKHNPGTTEDGVQKWKLKELIQKPSGSNIDEKLIYVETGNADSDYGEYVLVTMAADGKLDPHTGTGPQRTNKNGWSWNVWKISVVDENAPLIVFDTENGSPEENTFPVLDDSGTKFTIRGYTLRENMSGKNGVTKFRMAWIPYNMPKDGKPASDSYIAAVQTALKATNYPDSFNELTGIQHWDFKTPNTAGFAKGQFTGTDEVGDVGSSVTISKDTYRQQDFEKEFQIMSVADDIKSSYKNFTYNNILENETKLFVFYAQDNMGHDVFRQMRLLGMKTAPTLTVLDLTHKVSTSELESAGVAGAAPNALPDPNLPANINTVTGIFTTAYYTQLNQYNAKTAVTNKIRDGKEGGAAALAFTMYPRETVIKYFISAAKSGSIPVKSISMRDITLVSRDQATVIGSNYSNVNTQDLTFCESYPDIAQRTFLFEAEDMLGNRASLQRTVAITNAARLENITTTSQEGTYGIGKTITLKANFTSQIYVSGGRLPRLNVRYKNNASTDPNKYVYKSIACVDTALRPMPTVAKPALVLEFDLTVEEGDSGDVETMFEGITDYTPPGDWGGDKNPITYPSGTPAVYIMDYTRKNVAFIPGHTSESITVPNWVDNKNTLQGSKKITLDGSRPVITGVTADANGKAYYTSTHYYVKTGETVNFTLTSDKDIRAGSDPAPRLEFQIRQSGNTLSGYYSTVFTYSRPGSSSKALVFSLPITTTGGFPDGELVNVRLVSGNGILSNVDNTVALTTLPTVGGSVRIFIKQTVPAAPSATGTTIGGTQFGTTVTTNPLPRFNADPALVIPDSTSTWNSGTPAANPNNNWEDGKQYSTNGGATWTAYTASVTPVLNNGTYTVQARYVDRAGNEGPVRARVIQVNKNFPALVSVSAVQPNGYYLEGSTLTFNLNFADTVRVTTVANVTITLRNRAANSTDATTYITRTTTTAAGTEGTTIAFNWPGITNYEMRDGLYISAVNLGGLTDLFNITGPTGGTATWNAGTGASAISINSCPNLPAGLIVDAIPPSVTASTPQHNVTPSGNTAVSQITLTFREPVMKGNGIITIRPRGNYAIPPVIRDKEYYLGTNGTEYTEAGTNRTYISSFYDIYNAITDIKNASGVVTTSAATLRGYLTEGSSMSDLTQNPRTSLNKGPYIKMTHGLVSGYGYTGNYTGTDVTSGANAPDLGGTNGYTAMIPDIATKWVLDYQYGITQNNTTVNRIRDALTNAKWRWQEIDVVNTTIGGTNNTQVTIPLTEPLLKGLEWDVYYPATAFTDIAGNNAVKSGNFNADGTTAGSNNDYYFTSPGVQPPVVRVNRRSYDARNSNWSTVTVNNQDCTSLYAAPPNSTDWGLTTTDFAVNGTTSTTTAGDKGWGITNFNTVHYRVESESPSATVTVKTYQGTAASGNRGAVTAAWDGDVQTTSLNAGATLRGNMAWDAVATNAPGTWVLSNLIRRSNTYTGGTIANLPAYTVITKNGTPESRRSANVYSRLFRSYNRDLTKTELDGTLPTTPTAEEYANGQGIFSYTALEASKSYVVAVANKNGQNATGYEGVYRTVIVFNYNNNRGTYFAVQGSNIKNGMPSIAGFPARDAGELEDNRYNKIFYSSTNRRFYWVSTEIVCEWYFLTWGGRSGTNGTHQTTGEVNNYLMIGYGDLTYSFNTYNSNMTGNNNN